MTTRNRIGVLIAGLVLIAPAIWFFANDHPLRALPVVMISTFLLLTGALFGRLPAGLIAVPSIVVVGFIVTMAVGWSPQLGLDLQGGVSVVLKPVAEGGQALDVPDEALDETKAIIERRVNAFGVGEPEITRQGKTIVVQIPGIKDQQRALDLVGKTAELRFRPVLQELQRAPSAEDLAQIPDLRAKLGIPGDISAITIINDELTKRGLPAQPGDPSTTTTAPVAPPEGEIDPNLGVPPATPGSGTPEVVPDGAGDGSGGNRSAMRALRAAQDPTTVAPGGPESSVVGDTSSTTSTSTTTTTIDPTPVNSYGITVFKNEKGEPVDDLQRLAQLEIARDEANAALTSPEDDLKDAEVTLAGTEETGADGQKYTPRYKLGPSLLEGQAVETATAGISQQNAQWEVRPVFRDGADGIDLFNAVAAQCFNGDSVCPSKRLAIVLDGEVQSAPSINAPNFSRDSIQISGSFTEKRAKDVALALRFGSLPIQLEPQQIETVSATLGKGALRAGLIAGGVGLAVVALYIVMYYRVLGLITIGSLAMSAGTLWAIISLLGEEIGLTLTLSGIVGIIVSIGVSLDSSVVYFENLKEDVRKGRTVRSSIDRSFTGAFSTMVKADMSSLIGAAILYLITVGPVKGFAFYLGLSTILDLTFTYFFLHPVAKLVVNTRLGTSPKFFGIPKDVVHDVGAAPVTGVPAS